MLIAILFFGFNCFSVFSFPWFNRRLEPLPPQTTKEKRWSSPILERTNDGTGKNIRKSKVPFSSRAKTVIKSVRTDGKTG